MRALRLLKILDFYDIPQLFLASDIFGVRYLCLFNRYENNYGYFYLAVPITNDRIKLFIDGQLDLRQVYTQPEIENSYMQVIVRKGNITADFFNNAINESMLPAVGCYYEPEDGIDDLDLIEKTQYERVTIFRLGFVDQNNSHEIDSECLAQALSSFQHTISSCHRKLRGKQYVLESKLSVTAFQAASFDVELKSSSETNLFGGSQLSDTLLVISELMKTSNEEVFKSLLRNVQGRTVSNFKNFIKVLNEHRLSIKYKWVKSIVDNQIESAMIPVERVEQIYELLNRNNELELETNSYTGVFLASSVENGHWTLKLEGEENRNKIVSGESEEKSILSGITIEQKRYKITCKEIQLQNVATLQKENKSILIDVEEIQ